MLLHHDRLHSFLTAQSRFALGTTYLLLQRDSERELSSNPALNILDSVMYLQSS